MKEKISLFDVPDDRAVSPVIGVILMVAVTVILAAVIGTFVFGFGENVDQTANAGANISPDLGSPGSADVTWISEGNADRVNVTVQSADNANVTIPNSTEISNVGDVVTIAENDSSADINLNMNSSDADLDNEVTIVVKAVQGETTTVVQVEDVTL